MHRAVPSIHHSSRLTAVNEIGRKSAGSTPPGGFAPVPGGVVPGAVVGVTVEVVGVVEVVEDVEDVGAPVVDVELLEAAGELLQAALVRASAATATPISEGARRSRRLMRTSLRTSPGCTAARGSRQQETLITSQTSRQPSSLHGPAPVRHDLRAARTARARRWRGYSPANSSLSTAAPECSRCDWLRRRCWHWRGWRPRKTVRSLYGRKAFPDAGELARESFELLEVESGQGCETLVTLLAELQPDDTVVVLVPRALHQTGSICSVDESDRAVVTKEEVVGHLADGRTTRVIVTAYGEHQLVLGWSQTGGASLQLAPSLEVAKAGPQPEQAGVHGVGQNHIAHDIIVSR